MGLLGEGSFAVDLDRKPAVCRDWQNRLGREQGQQLSADTKLKRREAGPLKERERDSLITGSASVQLRQVAHTLFRPRLRPLQVQLSCRNVDEYSVASRDSEVSKCGHVMTLPPTNPLHLLRALLRECTYLPDPNSRIYIHNHVLWSFRNYLPKIKARRKDVPLQRQVSLLHRGRKSLSTLRRANEGYLKPLDRVLMLTYGRKGKRRRELMEKLMAPAIPQNNDELEKLVVPSLYTKEWKPSAAVEALMKSQSQQRGFLDKTNKKIRTEPSIPDKNIWGRAMPQARVKNLTRAWYTNQIDHLYPPLPDDERAELYSRASGKTAWHPVIRRAKVGADSTKTVETEYHKILLDGPQKGPTFKAFVDGRPHQLTARLMRRMWASIYRHTPRMIYDSESKRWKVVWNDVLKEVPTVAMIPSQAQEAALFREVRETT